MEEMLIVTHYNDPALTTALLDGLFLNISDYNGFPGSLLTVVLNPNSCII